MKFIFWQNTLSIHQSAFIRQLSEFHEVSLIVQQDIDETRKKHGWNVPNFGGTKIIINSESLNIRDQFNDKNTVHVFTGINAFPLVFNAFKIAIKCNSKTIVQLEPYNWVFGKFMLRQLKYKLLALMYRRRVDGVLGISSKGVECYTKAGFSPNQTFEWGYFTEIPIMKTFKNNDSSKLLPRFIYVGSLDQRKNLLTFLAIIAKYQNSFSEFSIYGTGVLSSEMRAYESEKIKFYGNLPNDEIHMKIREADFLILPSLFDGWGAVVNEALMVGTRVFCSSNCGASDLVNFDRGIVFNIESNDFEEKFKMMIEKGKVSENERQKIKNWALKNISGQAASKYFEEIVDHVYKKSSTKPVAPWL